LAEIPLHHTIIQIRRQAQGNTIEANQNEDNREKRIVIESIAQRREGNGKEKHQPKKKERRKGGRCL
jgi:hypothetical protein